MGWEELSLRGVPSLLSKLKQIETINLPTLTERGENVKQVMREKTIREDEKSDGKERVAVRGEK